MDPTVLVFLAVFGAGWLTGSGATHALAKGATATKHAVTRVFHHHPKKADEPAPSQN